MMTLDEVITTAKEVYKNPSLYVDCKGEHRQLLKQLTDWLEELKALREKNRWIPCSERLPEQKQVVVVDVGDSFKYGRYLFAYLTTENYVDVWRNARTDYKIFSNIISWMPLPKKYKEDEDAVN